MRLISLLSDVEKSGNLKESFEDFVQGKYVQDSISRDLSGLNCPLEEYMEGLFDYYNDVILVGRTS